MKQKIYGCFRACEKLFTGSLALMVLAIILSIRPSLAVADDYPTGKHDERIETWAFHSRFDLPEKDGALYLGMFFCSGSLYFLKGNFAHIFWLDTSTGEYKYENNIFIPPFEKVTHNEKTLNEKYSNSFFRYNAGKKKFLTYIDFDKFCAEMSLFPEKRPFDYDCVVKRDPKKKNFDWYMFPRLNIEAELDSVYDLFTTGQGHFQHFWGNTVDESSDFIVVHLDSGYDIVINDIQKPSDGDPALRPIEYFLVSDPDGKVHKLSSFEYLIREWAPSGNKGNKYPVHVTVKSNEMNLELDIRVFKKDQTANLLGVEKWFGYAAVEGQIDNKPQKGWAFFSPIGVKE